MLHSSSLSLSLSSSSPLFAMTKRRPKSSVNGDFELRHWQPSRRNHHKHRRPPGLQIPNGDSKSKLSETHEFDEIEDSDEDGGERGYVSLRDILTSPEYAAATSPGGGGSCTEINISNPLVMRAAYAYLQPTPSTREIAGRRRIELRKVVVEIFSPCFEFLGGIFNLRR
ncbi:hypothetical protein LUZ60_007458 [Juncus effusus]|nr:hypothetical protein LUZ60_007458 [Juncus effusus]